jgi:uncharacterized membrane protein YeiH
MAMVNELPSDALETLAQAASVARDALPILDAVGLAVFALSGALAAARQQQTLVTFAFFALATGVGGGTLRDLLIGAPVFWVHASWVPLTCLGMALLVWMTPQRWWSGRALEWADAAGLAAYSVFGTAKSLSFGIDPLPAALMGVLTACAGGIIRDLLAGQPSIILRPELYVTAAALSAGLFVILLIAGAGFLLAALIAGVSGFALRGFAIHRQIGLPIYRR